MASGTHAVADTRLVNAEAQLPTATGSGVQVEYVTGSQTIDGYTLPGYLLGILVRSSTDGFFLGFDMHPNTNELYLVKKIQGTWTKAKKIGITKTTFTVSNTETQTVDLSSYKNYVLLDVYVNNMTLSLRDNSQVTSLNFNSQSGTLTLVKAGAGSWANTAATVLLYGPID